MYFLLAYFIEKVIDDYLFFFFNLSNIIKKTKKALISNIFGLVMDPQHINLCRSHIFFSFILFY